VSIIFEKSNFTWSPEDIQGLPAHGHSWPLPAELVVRCEKNGTNRGTTKYEISRLEQNVEEARTIVSDTLAAAPNLP
jgi:hypothetical protein